MEDCTNTSKPSRFEISDNCAFFDFVVNSVIGGLLVILGTAGNALSFIVLWYDNGKTATVFLLRCLSIADTLVLLAAVPLYVLPYVYPYTGLMQSYYEAYLNLVHLLWPAYLIPYTGTIMLTVLVSANRYICVCRPFSSSKQSSRKSAHKHVIYIALFSVLYNIPRFFEYHKVEVCDGVNKTKTVFDLSDFGNNKMYRIIYANVMYFIVMHGGPLLLLAFLNIQLIIALKKRRQMRYELGKTSDKGYQQDVTLVLIVVICCFMFCQTPTFVDHLLWTFLDQSKRGCGQWHYFYTALADLFAILNSSVNFVIYTLTSQRFRQNLSATCINEQSTFERVPMTIANGAHTNAPKCATTGENNKSPSPINSLDSSKNRLLQDEEKESDIAKV